MQQRALEADCPALAVAQAAETAVAVFAGNAAVAGLVVDESAECLAAQSWGHILLLLDIYSPYQREFLRKKYHTMRKTKEKKRRAPKEYLSGESVEE